MRVGKEGYLWNRKWLWIVILIGFAVFLSYLKPLKLEEGGEMTYLSMLVIYLVGYFYGGRTGLAAAFLYGAIKYFLDYPLIVNVPELWDYILGYGLLGAGGFLADRKYGLQKGYLLAALLRYIESVWNCIWFYYMYEESVAANIQYGLIYCIGYIGAEALITFLVLCIPPVREAIEYLKYVATNEYEEDLDTF